MVAAEGRFDQRHRLISQPRHAKGTQRGLGIRQGSDLTRQRCRDLKKRGLDAHSVEVLPPGLHRLLAIQQNLVGPIWVNQPRSHCLDV